MYKIFINDKPFILTEEASLSEVRHGVMVLCFKEIHKLEHAIKLMRQSEVKSVIVTGDVEKMWKEFQSYFKLIEAAGGVVKNAENELLFTTKIHIQVIL